MIDQNYLLKIEDTYKEMGFGIQWHMMSKYIIMQTLGKDWYEKKCSLHNHRDAPFNQNLDDDLQALDYHLTIVRLGHMLFLMRNYQGFEGLMEDLSNRNIEPVFFELRAAALFVQNNYPIQFIRPIGVKGEDYDLETVIDGQRVAIEVKTRRSGPIKNANSLKNALKRAKEQISRKRPGIICIVITDEYETLESTHHVKKEIDDKLRAFLYGTKRVNDIIVFWYKWTSNPPVCKTMVTEYRNYYARNTIEREYLIERVPEMVLKSGVQNGFPSFMSKV